MLFHGLYQSNIPNGKTASSLFFPSNLVRVMHARGSGEAAIRAKRGRKHEKKKERLFSCRSRPAPSVTRVAICVSHVLLDRLQKKETLLVVYLMVGF